MYKWVSPFTNPTKPIPNLPKPLGLVCIMRGDGGSFQISSSLSVRYLIALIKNEPFPCLGQLFATIAYNTPDSTL